MTDSELQIRELFEKCNFVCFYSRNRNYLKWRKIAIKEKVISFLFFLKVIGVRPEQLAPLLTTRNKLKCNITLSSLEDLPDTVSFGASKEEYQELAKLIGKPVAIYREYEQTPSQHLFTVYPDGRLKLLLEEDV